MSKSEQGTIEVSSVLPRFTRNSSYSVDVDWRYLEKWLAEAADYPGLDLEPDFQRAHVWTEEQQSRFVAYLLRGGYSAREIHFNCPSWIRQGPNTPMVIVDGKQRLEAVRKFMRNELQVAGHYRSEFKLLRMNDASFKIHVNDLATRKEVLQWYLDLNDGGTPHTAEEIEKVQRMLMNES